MQIYVIDDKKPGLYGSVVSSPTHVLLELATELRLNACRRAANPGTDNAEVEAPDAKLLWDSCDNLLCEQRGRMLGAVCPGAV
jgi:hypothetical protein